jgi:hypothetical protein
VRYFELLLAVYFTHLVALRFPGRAFAAGTDLGDGQAGMVRLAPVARLRRLLNFIGSTSGPLTMKWPLIIRMVL